MPKKLPKIINTEEFEKLLKAVDKVKRISKRRKKEYKIALILGFQAGMRISEIVGFKDKIKPLSQEQIDNSSIRILGKGEKERIVPRPKKINENALKLLPLKIKRRALQNLVTNLGKEVLNKKITFHTLRHGFCSHLAGQGRPLHEVQMLAGHSRLDTTGIYLHANPKQAIAEARELF